MAPQKIVCPTIFVVFATLLLLCGIGQTITSCFAIYYSGVSFIGGIYAGVAFILVGLRSYQVHTRGWYIFDSVLLGIAIISAVVAVAILGAVYGQLSSFTASSNYSDSLSTSCSITGSVSSNYRCYGDSSYFFAAEFCAADYSVNYSKDDRVCNCVKEDFADDSNCYYFDYIPSCEYFMSDLPAVVLICLIFAGVGFVIGLVLLVMIVLSLCCKKTMGLDQESDEEDRADITDSLLPQTPTVVVASAPLYTNNGPTPNYTYNHPNPYNQQSNHYSSTPHLDQTNRY